MECRVDLPAELYLLRVQGDRDVRDRSRPGDHPEDGRYELRAVLHEGQGRRLHQVATRGPTLVRRVLTVRAAQALWGARIGNSDVVVHTSSRCAELVRGLRGQGSRARSGRE